MSSGDSAPDLPLFTDFWGRILFICYLEARRALVGRDFGRLGAGATATFRQILIFPIIIRAGRPLTRLFRRLARTFKGNLFDGGFIADVDRVRDTDLITLRDLITGHDLGTGKWCFHSTSMTQRHTD